MEKKVGYCPMCDKEVIVTTKASMIYYPDCNHHIDLHPWFPPCKNPNGKK